MLFFYFVCFIFLISFVVGIVGFFIDITTFNDKKKKTIITSSADGGEDDGTVGTDTGSITTDITELE